MLTDLLNVSRLLQVQLEKAFANPVWHQLLTAPMNQFAVSKTAWDEFVDSVGQEPPTLDPQRLWEWAESSLWKLLVFLDPDEACDNDQCDLELWWSPSSQRAAFVCGFGEHFVFRGRTKRVLGKPTTWEPLETWAGATDDLVPAPREVVSRSFPDATLLD